MATDSKVRVRFAPSPTGQVHVGNARTALFNWLFARQRGGTMVLRIEDTDVERSEARYETQLLDDMKWLGLDWDEGPDAGGPYAPYRQSERLNVYHEYADKLLSQGDAYLCFCAPEELERQRERALAEHRNPPRYCQCRDLASADAAQRRDQGEAAAIRLKIPERPIRFHDIVRGAVEFAPEDVPDLVIVRSTGMPVYNYVVVVDDALMKITHVIRGDDHLSNTPKQVALYEALGWPVPEFAHLSTILGADRTRLSKRHGATSLANFRESGVLPEALLNYLALLGWAPTGGTREIFAAAELLKEFDLSRVTSSPAVFDMEKLYWLNRHYIKESSPERIHKLALPYFERAFAQKAGQSTPAQSYPWSPAAVAWFGKVTDLLAPSVDRLDQLPERASFIYAFDARRALETPDNAEVLASPKTDAVLDAFAKAIAGDPEAQADRLTPERFKSIMNHVKTEAGAKGKELFHPVRIALTGSHSGPEFDKTIPLIEEGSRLPLPVHISSVRERTASFMQARKAAARA